MAKSKKKAKSTTGRAKSKARIAKRPPAEKAAVKVELQYIPWHMIPLEDLNPLLQRQFVVGQQIMLARVLLKKGCIVPLHSHHNEQLTYIVEGALKFIDFMVSPDFYVKWGTDVGAPASANAKANAQLPEDDVNRKLLGDPEVVKRLQWMAPMSDEQKAKYQELWDEAKTYFAQ